jgi:hypothetical protein
MKLWSMVGHEGDWDSKDVEGDDIHLAALASKMNMPKPNPPRQVTQKEVWDAYLAWIVGPPPPPPPGAIFGPSGTTTFTPPPGAPIPYQKPFKKKKADR